MKISYYVILIILILGLAAGYRYSIKISQSPYPPDSEELYESLYMMHNDSLESGGFLIKNRGNQTISNITLELKPVKEISPQVRAHMERIWKKFGKNKTVKLIEEVKFRPEKINIKELNPGESIYVQVNASPLGRGNFFGVNVLLKNRSIYRLSGKLTP